MQTFLIIFITISSLFFFGLPMAVLFADSKRRPEHIWVTAPFLGLAVIILVLQNLVYLNVPIQFSAPWAWIGMAILWVFLIRKKRFSFSLLPIPFLPLIAAVALYLIHGLGLLISGANIYMGRAWHDQYNSTVISQFLIDYPFHASVQDMVGKPQLLMAVLEHNGIIFKLDRIGVMIFQGFLSVITHSSAKATFESCILVSPFLIGLAIYLLGRELEMPKWKALLTSICAGFMPAITMIHLESFFAQALAIPYFLLWPYIIISWIRSPNLRNYLQASFLLAAATSIYPEFYIFYILVSGSILGFHLYMSSSRYIFHFLSLFLLLILALLWNIGFFLGIITILKRVTLENIGLLSIYPWARSFEGVLRLWSGELSNRISPWGAYFITMISCFFLFISYKGLVQVFLQNKNIFAFAVLIIVLIPVCIFLGGIPYSYQFYKTFLSVSPLFPLGIFLGNFPKSNYFMDNFRISFFLGKWALILLLSLPTLASVDMVWRSATGKTQSEMGRGGAFKLVDPSTLAIESLLSNLRDKTILILWKDDFWDGNYLNAWLSYFTRHNYVWIGNPSIGGINLDNFPGVNQLPKNLAPETYLVTSPMYSRSVSGSDVQLLCSEGPYAFWKIAGPDWVSFSNINNPNGLEWILKDDFFWIGNSDTIFEVVAGRPGLLTLTAQVLPGPSSPDLKTRHILITTDGGHRQNKSIYFNSDLFLSIPIQAGQTRVNIRCLDQPTIHRLPNGDTRILLLQVRHLKISDFEQETN
jgi:hypothetical protein